MDWQFWHKSKEALLMFSLVANIPRNKSISFWSRPFPFQRSPKSWRRIMGMSSLSNIFDGNLKIISFVHPSPLVKANHPYCNFGNLKAIEIELDATNSFVPEQEGGKLSTNGFIIFRAKLLWLAKKWRPDVKVNWKNLSHF